MLSFIELNKPSIDLDLYDLENNITPIDWVRIMNEDTFEQFILEWLYGCKNEKYSSIRKIGGAGDKGRDIIGFNHNGTVDYYQCKHYNKPLAPTNFYLELGKLCYYTYKKEIPLPSEYYIIASNDIGPNLQDLIDNPSELLNNFKNNWDNYCKSKITNTEEVFLSGGFLKYVNSFDFTIINTYPITQILNEYLKTTYGIIRFKGCKFNLPSPLTPPDTIDTVEMPYISALLEAYSDELRIKINGIEMLKKHNCYFEHLKRQRKDYYSIETIRRFVRDIFTNSKQFDILKDEIYDGVIDVYEQQYENGYKRLVEVLKQASLTNTSKSKLDCKLHCIGNSERKGICHMLVNDNKLRWVKEDEQSF